MTKITIDNHYVPRFIQKGFSFNPDSDEPKVYYVDMTKGIHHSKLVTKRKTRKLWYQEYLYEQEKEDAFESYMETPFSNILNRKVMKSQKYVELDSREENIMRKYFLGQWIRTPDLKDKFDKETGVSTDLRWVDLLELFVKDDTNLFLLSHHPDPYISKSANIILNCPLIFLNTDDEFVLNDGGMYASYYNEIADFIDEIKPDDSNGSWMMEVGLKMDQTDGSIMTYMLYPLKSNIAALLLNPLWAFNEFKDKVESGSSSSGRLVSNPIGISNIIREAEMSKEDFYYGIAKKHHRIVKIMPLKTKAINRATICTSKNGFIFKTPELLRETIVTQFVSEFNSEVEEPYRAISRRLSKHINGIEPIE